MSRFIIYLLFLPLGCLLAQEDEAPKNWSLEFYANPLLLNNTFDPMPENSLSDLEEFSKPILVSNFGIGAYVDLNEKYQSRFGLQYSKTASRYRDAPGNPMSSISVISGDFKYSHLDLTIGTRFMFRKRPKASLYFSVDCSLRFKHLHKSQVHYYGVYNDGTSFDFSGKLDMSGYNSLNLGPFMFGLGYSKTLVQGLNLNVEPNYSIVLENFRANQLRYTAFGLRLGLEMNDFSWLRNKESATEGKSL